MASVYNFMCGTHLLKGTINFIDKSTIMAFTCQKLLYTKQCRYCSFINWKYDSKKKPCSRNTTKHYHHNTTVRFVQTYEIPVSGAIVSESDDYHKNSKIYSKNSDKELSPNGAEDTSKELQLSDKISDEIQASQQRREILAVRKLLQKYYNPEQVTDVETEKAIVTTTEALDVESLRPTAPMSAASLAAYVNHSHTLTQLVHLGVDLARVDKHKGLANYYLRMQFENHVKPYLEFLCSVGIELADLGSVINKNLAIFKVGLDDLEVRINYLLSKRFPESAVTKIVTMAPKLLSLPTTNIDQRLGFIQKEFALTGDEVRAVVTAYPPITLCSQTELSEHNLAYRDFMGFPDTDLKQLLVALPKLFTIGPGAAIERFDYFHNTMGITHSEMLEYPGMLQTSCDKVKCRHEFLKLVGRDQFDPKKPNYVTLKDLVTRTDDVFCEQVAKVSPDVYSDFLKTL